MRGAAILGVVTLLPACGGLSDSVALVFPDGDAHDATSVVAVTVFEPLITPTDKTVPELVGCDAVGVFAPTRTAKLESKPEGIDPEEVSAIPNLGQLLSEVREPQSFPFDGDEWDLDIPRVRADDTTNPWGAALVYVEARGNVRSSREQGGGQVMATLLAGCYCVRTKADGSHPDRSLDSKVKQACADITSGEAVEREIRLEPVMNSQFRLDPNTVQSLTAPRGQLLSPGPQVQVQANRCDSAAPGPNCYRCTQPCNELNDRRNVPVLFTVDQPGGASSPASQIVLTDRTGVAAAQITVDQCSSPLKVRARVVGRMDPPVEFEVNCVRAVTEWDCPDQRSLGSLGDPVALAAVPGEPGEPEHLAVLFDETTGPRVEILNTVIGTSTGWRFPAGETPKAVHGFHYVMPTASSPGREPALVVMTAAGGSRPEARLYLFRWQNNRLVPQGGPLTPFSRACSRWLCDKFPQTLITPSAGEVCPDPNATPMGMIMDLDATRACICDGQGCVAPNGATTCGCPVACKLTLDFQTTITMTTADLDADGRADLAMGTSSDLPITYYYSTQATGGRLYDEAGCQCARYGQSPSTFALLDLGGANQGASAGPIDLVIGAPGGAFVRYGIPRTGGGSEIACGSAGRFGELVPVRDVAPGNFQCSREVSGNCAPFDDLVLVAAKSLGGGSLDDPGTIRGVYGADTDLIDETLFDQPGATIELVPIPAPAQTEPRDPRAVRVADFNCDTMDDVAVFFGTSEEVHVWLSGGQRGLGETGTSVLLSQCGATTGKCGVLKQMAVADWDGDGAKEIFVICSPTSDPKLRRYRPMPSCR